MITLNLEAKTKADELIKAFLEENASEILANKINNGVKIVKDGKTLINKKDLKGFMCYANSEARKQAAKGENSACVEDKVVYGWAVHYFEEDSIEGTLYNEDGTQYKAPIKTATKSTAKPVTPLAPPKPEKKQESIFDMLSASFTAQNGAGVPNPYETADRIKEKYLNATDDGENDDEELNDDYTPEELQELADEAEDNEEAITPVIPHIQPQKQPTPLYQSYLQLQAKYKDCILWIRLGDFYEALGESARTAANELDLTLTGRDCGLKERIPMCGVPYHAADVYFEKLLSKGYKLAVAEDRKGESVSVLNKKTVTDEHGQTVDIETGEIINAVDELSEEELRKFDSYVDESEELPTVSKITEGLVDDNANEDAELAYEKELAKAFDKEALCIISDLFDGEITLA